MLPVRQVDRVTIIRDLEQKIKHHYQQWMIYQQMLNDFTTAREKYFNITLEDCELTVRTTNALRAEGYVFVGDVASRSKQVLLKIPNLGRKSVTELEEMLANLGMTFEEALYQNWVRPEHPIKPAGPSVENNDGH